MIHNNEVISIEEDLLNCRQMIRRFTFNNRNNGLKIGVLTIGASLVSCELDSHQIIVSQNTNIESTPQLRTNWISHVRGPDTLCLSSGLSSSQSQSIVYQLTQQNELIVIGRFKSQQQFFSPYFFNLNCATNKPLLNGHYLQIRCSDSSAIIRQQITSNNLMGDCGQQNEINFVAPTAAPIPVTNDETKDFDFDAIYCLTSVNSSDAQLIAILRYENKTVEVILQNNSVGHHSQQQTQQTNNCLNLKLRIRITNGAVCIMPALMSEFKCVYRFVW